MIDRWRGQPVWPWGLAAVSVIAAIASVAYLISTRSEPRADPGVFSAVATTAGELAAEAEAMNATWDAQQEQLADPERLELFRQTAAAMDDLIVATDTLVADVAALDAPDGPVLAAAQSMAGHARDMLAGLNAPGRGNVGQRQEALAAYREAADQVRAAAGASSQAGMPGGAADQLYQLAGQSPELLGGWAAALFLAAVTARTEL